MVDNVNIPKQLISYNDVELRKFITTLLTRLDKLEKRIQELEKRVQELENGN